MKLSTPTTTVARDAEQRRVRALSLDGATILRFVRGYASGAGLEYDVAMINRALCERHAVHVIQIHMAKSGESLARSEAVLGRGRVTSIPLRRDPLPVSGSGNRPHRAAALLAQCKCGFRDHVLFNPLSGPWFTRLMGARHPRPKHGDVPGVGDTVRQIVSSQKVDLAVVHAAGGSDAWEAIDGAQRHNVPVAMQLHFANERFKDYSVRIQVARVDGIGGVSDVDVPPYLGDTFTNLLTAIDLDFFSRARAQPSGQRFRRPALILPARIVPTKGHDDLVEAVGQLRNWGISVDVIFAGRADQPEYEAALRRRIAAADLSDSFHFFGLLNPEQLRDLYSVCSVLAFPTHHQEGLPRVLLEAQAMELPAVLYDSGGSRAGVIPGKSGFVVSRGDVTGLAQSIRQLLQSADLAASFARAGRQFVEAEFGLTTLADRHERFIATTVDRFHFRRRGHMGTLPTEGAASNV